ncbi:nitric oxide synthase: inducible-like isoform X1, partial [Leptotrombidium deliense]
MKQLIEAITDACNSKNVQQTNERRQIKLRNITTGEESYDTAHVKASCPVTCNSDVCSGALQSSLTVVKHENRDSKQILSEAHEFLTDYYATKKDSDSSALMHRMNDIIKEVLAKGTYNLKEEELSYGAKVAWRNAPRCIGRVYWNKLKVFDARNVKTTKEMFEALCNHIKYATNNGKLRSTITVFPQRKQGFGDFKVWNTQLVTFAGYVDPTNAEIIIGDPQHVEFTQLCEKLGWKGKRTNFDILPLVLSANGGDPQVFPIPDELILTVRLRHPKYKWFEDLNIEWYALPAVSNMLMDVGGIEFPAAPFNGWFMATEIACRDLCDRHRYNILEKVALRMGLDTRSNSTLWKDFALLEIHAAVLHSFQQQGVTIVDHHTASESFIRHFENEKKLRGGCPADWAWIVPPTSSGITPVFHQEMLCYKLKPSFEYQEQAWKCHKWHNLPQSMLKRKVCFKVYATAVLFASQLFSKTLLNRIKVKIIYATETGKSEEYAKRLSRVLNSVFNVTVLCMDAYDVKQLENENLLFIITSTFGNGEAPENGECFARKLHFIASKDSKSQKYQNLKFAVFALGSTAYTNFAAFGKLIDELLGNIGAQRIKDVTTGDEICGEEQSFAGWSESVIKTSCDLFAIKDARNSINSNTNSITSKVWCKKNVKIIPLLKSPPAEVSSGLQSLIKGANRKIAPFRLKCRRDLLKSNSFDRRTVAVQLEFMANEEEVESKDGLSIDYVPGDHLALYPENSSAVVEELLQTLEVIHCDQTIEVFVKKSDEYVPYEKLPPTTIRQAFTRYLDITSPPSQQFLNILLQFCSKSEEIEEIVKLTTEFEYYENWKETRFPTIAETLQQFPSANPPLELILTELPSLKPRFYSISSSPLYNTRQKHMSNKCHSEKERQNEKNDKRNHKSQGLNEPKTLVDLTVAVVKYSTDVGSQHFGVCSNFLANVPVGHKVYGYIRSAPNFKMPDDPSVPVIMVGPGTGIAPFRSFWLRRCARSSLCPSERNLTSFGKMSLFFGCQVPEMRLYAAEVDEMKKNGVLQAVYNAYSRLPNQPKKYVQDLLRDYSLNVVRELIEEDGHIYVCGDVTMAKDVQITLASIFENNGYKKPESILLQLKKENRYHEDIYGVRHRVANQS